jgi:hypothetical protein
MWWLSSERRPSLTARAGITSAMSIHKLTAGSGYDYLTRQVAALDATHKGHIGLASYYTERGETPGVWVGAGIEGIDGLSPGDPVTAEQMRHLFGEGRHPLTGMPPAPGVPALSLGRPFPACHAGATAFQRERASRFQDAQTAAGWPSGCALPAEDRARIRSEVARDFFRAQHGRDPLDGRVLYAASETYIADAAVPRLLPTAVAALSVGAVTDREISRALVVLTQQGLAESSVRRFRASLSAFSPGRSVSG